MPTRIPSTVGGWEELPLLPSSKKTLELPQKHFCIKIILKLKIGVSDTAEGRGERNGFGKTPPRTDQLITTAYLLTPQSLPTAALPFPYHQRLPHKDGPGQSKPAKAHLFKSL